MAILRHTVIAAAVSMGVLMLGCMDFPTRFDRFRDDELRIAAVAFTPQAEASPGDTLSATVHFGGDSVTRLDSFKVTYSVVKNPYGTVDTFVNATQLDFIDSTSHLPDSFRYSFRVPVDVFVSRLAKQLAQPGPSAQEIGQDNGQHTDAFEAIIPYLGADDQIPPDSLLAFLGSIRPETADQIKAVATGAKAIFTAFSAAGRKLEVHASFTVRYNHWFSRMYELAYRTMPDSVVDSAVNDTARQMLSVNHNPQVSWLGICKVRLDEVGAWSYTPVSDSDYIDTLYLLRAAAGYIPDSNSRIDTVIITDTVVVDTGFIYFFIADSGIGDYNGNGTTDTLRDAYWARYTPEGDSVARDTLQYELYDFHWFYHNLDESDMPLDSLLTIQQVTLSPVKRIYTPLDTAMHDFSVWCAVQDWCIGKYLRPEAVTCVRADATFLYTDAYAKDVK